MSKVLTGEALYAERDLQRAATAKNHYQGSYRRVLCICSAGLLRSPTAALVLSQPPYNFNTRAAGIEDIFALIPADAVLLSWADEVVCMTEDQAPRLRKMLNEQGSRAPVICLGIPDQFPYRDPTLMRMIAESYEQQRRERD